MYNGSVSDGVHPAALEYFVSAGHPPELSSCFCRYFGLDGAAGLDADAGSLAVRRDDGVSLFHADRQFLLMLDSRKGSGEMGYYSRKYTLGLYVLEPGLAPRDRVPDRLAEWHPASVSDAAGKFRGFYRLLDGGNALDRVVIGVILENNGIKVEDEEVTVGCNGSACTIPLDERAIRFSGSQECVPSPERRALQLVQEADLPEKAGNNLMLLLAYKLSRQQLLRG
ncbi:MAG: hypothetical protein ABH879_04575 [archaeon]